MKAENATPNNFDAHNVIYLNDHFAIAYGLWVESGENVLAMRWTGDQSDPKDPGYPKVFGNPMWFIITNDLKILILSALMNSPLADKKKIVDLLNNEV